MSQSTFARFIAGVRSGSSRVAIAYTTNPSWPFPPQGPDTQSSKRLNIHVLDASFNPPTKAHLALAQTRKKESLESIYKANLLLLSISNADKTLTNNDASYIQRLEMMVLMAKSIAATAPPDHGGVAVAIINEPLFARKQEILSVYLLSALRNNSVNVDVVWQVGLDTLKRLFDPKYYDNNKAMMLHTLRAFLREPGETHVGAQLLCAQRRMSGVDLGHSTVSGSEEFVASGRIELVEIGDWESSLSSTSVREGIKLGDMSWEIACEGDVCDYIKKEHLYQ